MLPYELTYREIAGSLCISMNTLKTRTQHIRRKLGVASRSEAVRPRAGADCSELYSPRSLPVA